MSHLVLLTFHEIVVFFIYEMEKQQPRPKVKKDCTKRNEWELKDKSPASKFPLHGLCACSLIHLSAPKIKAVTLAKNNVFCICPSLLCK